MKDKLNALSPRLACRWVSDGNGHLYGIWEYETDLQVKLQKEQEAKENRDLYADLRRRINRDRDSA